MSSGTESRKLGKALKQKIGERKEEGNKMRGVSRREEWVRTGREGAGIGLWGTLEAEKDPKGAGGSK